MLFGTEGCARGTELPQPRSGWTTQPRFAPRNRGRGPSNPSRTAERYYKREPAPLYNRSAVGESLRSLSPVALREPGLCYTTAPRLGNPAPTIATPCRRLCPTGAGDFQATSSAPTSLRGGR